MQSDKMQDVAVSWFTPLVSVDLCFECDELSAVVVWLL